MANGIDTQDLDLEKYLAQLEIDLQQQVDDEKLTEEEMVAKLGEARINYVPPQPESPTQIKINGHFYTTDQIIKNIENPEKGSDWEKIDDLNHYLELLKIDGHNVEEADGISLSTGEVPNINITDEAKLQFEDTELPSQTPYAEQMNTVGENIKNTFTKTPVKTYNDLKPLNEAINDITDGAPDILVSKPENVAAEKIYPYSHDANHPHEKWKKKILPENIHLLNKEFDSLKEKYRLDLEKRFPDYTPKQIEQALTKQEQLFGFENAKGEWIKKTDPMDFYNISPEYEQYLNSIINTFEFDDYESFDGISKNYWAAVHVSLNNDSVIQSRIEFAKMAMERMFQTDFYDLVKKYKEEGKLNNPEDLELVQAEWNKNMKAKHQELLLNDDIYQTRHAHILAAAEEVFLNKFLDFERSKIPAWSKIDKAWKAKQDELAAARIKLEKNEISQSDYDKLEAEAAEYGKNSESWTKMKMQFKKMITGDLPMIWGKKTYERLKAISAIDKENLPSFVTEDTTLDELTKMYAKAKGCEEDPACLKRMKEIESIIPGIDGEFNYLPSAPFQDYLQVLNRAGDGGFFAELERALLGDRYSKVEAEDLYFAHNENPPLTRHSTLKEYFNLAEEAWPKEQKKMAERFKSFMEQKNIIDLNREGEGSRYELESEDLGRHLMQQLPQMGPAYLGALMEGLGNVPQLRVLKYPGKALKYLGAASIYAQEFTGNYIEGIRKEIMRDNGGTEPTEEEWFEALSNPEYGDVFLSGTGAAASSSMELFGVGKLAKLGGLTLQQSQKLVARFFSKEIAKYVTTAAGRKSLIMGIANVAEGGITEYITEGMQGWMSDFVTNIQKYDGDMGRSFWDAEFDQEGADVGGRIGLFLPFAGKVVSQSLVDLKGIARDIVTKFSMNKLAPTFHSTNKFFNDAISKIRKDIDNNIVSPTEGRAAIAELSTLRNIGVSMPTNIDGRQRDKLARLLIEQKKQQEIIESIDNKELSDPNKVKLLDTNLQILDIVTKNSNKVDYLKQVGNIRDIINQSDGDVSIMTGKNKKAVENILEKLNKRGWKLDKKSSANYGNFFHDPNTGKQIIVLNEDEILKDGKINTGAHEFLHALLYQTVRNSKGSAIALGNGLLEYIKTANPSLLKKGYFKRRLDKYKSMDNISTELQAEEVLTLFSEGVLDGAIVMNDNVATKVNDFFRRIWHSWGFGEWNFNKKDGGKQIYNFIKDYNRSIRKGKFTTAQNRLLTQRAGGDLVKRQYNPNETTTSKPSIKDGAKTLDELTADYQVASDPNSDTLSYEDVDIVDLSQQYTAASVKALQNWAAKKGVPLKLFTKNNQGNTVLTEQGQDAVSMIGVEFEGIMKNYKPINPETGKKQSVSNYLYNTIGLKVGTKLAAEHSRKGQQVSQDVLTEKGVSPKTSEQPDLDIKDKPSGKRKKVFPNKVKVIKDNITLETRADQMTLLKKDIEEAIMRVGAKPKDIAKYIIEKIKSPEYRKLIKDSLGKFGSEQYINNVEKLFENKDFISSIPVASIKRRFGKLFGIKQTGTVKTKKTEDGKTTYFDKPVFSIPAITDKKLQKIKEYFLANEKHHQSLMSLIGEGIAIEQLQELSTDTVFMEELANRLDFKDSTQTAESFMQEFEFNLDKRNLEDTSFDESKASLKDYTPTVDEGGRAYKNLKDISQVRDINAALRVLVPGGKVIKITPENIDTVQTLLETVVEKGGLGTNVLTYSQFGNFGRKYTPGNIVNGKFVPNSKSTTSYYTMRDGTYLLRPKTRAKQNALLKNPKYIGKFMPRTGAYYGKSDPAYITLMKKAAQNDNSPLNKKLAALNPKRIKIPKGQKISKKFLEDNKDQLKTNQKALEVYTEILAQAHQNGVPLIEIAPFITASYQSTVGLIKISAGFKGVSKAFRYGKGTKYNQGQKYREEHSPPASVIGASLLWAIKNNQVAPTMQAIKDNYGQIQLSKLDDARIDNAGYAATLPIGTTIFDKNVDLARLAASGVNLNTLVNPITNKTLVEEMGLGINPIQAQNRSLVHYQNELVAGVVKGELSLKKAKEHLKISIPVNIAKNARVKFNSLKVAPTILNSDMTAQEVVDTFKNSINTKVNANKPSLKDKGISVFDFDDTLAKTKEKIIVNMPYYAPGSMTEATMELTPAEFAERAVELEEMGASFDFSQFENVKGAEKGPLADLALKRQGKFGSGDIFVLTARPQNSALGIQKFLKGIGLNIPLENITGLENGSPQAKANWVLSKTAEGYNNFYFADDHIPNVKAVKQILDQVDVKSDVQVAKASLPDVLDKDFNTMLQDTTGKENYKRYSSARAQLEGKLKDKGLWKGIKRTLTITPSADDFLGLMYSFAGKGKKGIQHLQWIHDNLIDPYNKAEQEILDAKVAAANDYNALTKKFPSLKGSSLSLSNPLQKQIGVGPYTKSHGVRVYIWAKQGMDIPGLSKTDKDRLVKAVEADSELNVFADEILLIQRTEKYPKPQNNWQAGTIATDIQRGLDTIFRNQVLTQWQTNVDAVFTPKNLDKIEALYGSKFREALEDSLRRMKSGSNRPVGYSRPVNELLDWLNASVGSIMFLNMRSGLLQLTSAINFINWGDNNILAAGKAFASAAYFPTVMKLMNSDYLVNRRDGLKINVNEAELVERGRKGGIQGMISYLLDKGFIITRIMDTLAIATGGASFFINRVKTYEKQGLTKTEAEAKAFDDFYKIAEETQQSSNPSKISQQQASSAGRVILSFQNVTMQYNRKTKKSIQNLYNRRKIPGLTQRESDLSHVSQIIYYTTIQNVIFHSLQQALFAVLFQGDEDEEEKNKTASIANGMLDSLLFGLGFGGAAISTVKNIMLELNKQHGKKTPKYEEAVWSAFDFSPVLDSKVRKLRSGLKTFSWEKEEMRKRGWSLDNPAYLAISQIVAAGTNIPLDRVMRKTMNLRAAMDEETRTWQRVALILGWDTWSVGLPYWGLESTIKREKGDREKAKNQYVIDRDRIKNQGFIKSDSKETPSGELGKDYYALEKWTGVLEYWVKGEPKKKTKKYTLKESKTSSNPKNQIKFDSIRKKKKADQVKTLLELGLNLQEVRDLKYEKDRIEKILELMQS